MRMAFLVSLTCSFLFSVWFVYSELSSPGMSIATGLIFVAGMVATYGFFNFDLEIRREMDTAALLTVGVTSLGIVYLSRSFPDWFTFSCCWGVSQGPLAIFGLYGLVGGSPSVHYHSSLTEAANKSNGIDPSATDEASLVQEPGHFGWLIAGVAIWCLVGTLPIFLSHFVRMFEEFEMTLPAVTQLLVSVPHVLFVVLSIMVVFFLLILRTMTIPKSCLLFERLFSGLGILVLGFSTVAIVQPLLKMWRGLG